MRGDRSLYILFFLGCALTGVLILYPAYYAVQLSFFDADSFISTPVWVGLENYKTVLADSEFWSALIRGIIFAGTAIFLQILLGIGFALILDSAIPGKIILRGITVLPYLLPTVVVALIFQWMLDDHIGILTVLLENLGFEEAATWANSPFWSMVLVIFVSVWLWTPFVTVCFLAGLQSVPEEMYEAARVDGANAWQRFWHITLPQLRPVLLVVVLLRAIWMFNKFDIVWLLTGGGPMHGTEHLPILAYRKAFDAFDVGIGATISTISFLILTIAILLFFWRFPIDERK
jgi:multiple sugar transport system permease protein